MTREKEESIERARTCDEQIVLNVLKRKYPNAIMRQTTREEDWQLKADILFCGKTIIKIDVKRNSETQKLSDNFTFTYFNNNGRLYKFDEFSYLVYIDEVENQFYFVKGLDFDKILNEKGWEYCNPKNGKAKLIKRSEVKKLAETKGYIWDMTEEDKKLLN